MFRYILIFAFVMAALSVVHADEVPPVPLRSEDVLNPHNVEVVETLPLWWTDGTALHLYDGTTLEWRTYALPIMPDDMLSVVPEANGTFTLTLCHPQPYMSYYGADNCTWHLDPATGEFTLIELVCGGLTSQGGEWVAYVNPTTRTSHFCNMRTGELSAQLPIDLDVMSTTGTPFAIYIVPSSTDTNPSGNLIVITLYGIYHTFNLVTGETLPLGPIEGMTISSRGVRWVDDTHLLFMTELGENTTPRRFNLYMADVTQPNSTQLIYSGEALQLPALYLYPDVFEWLGSDCAVYRLSFETLEVSNYTIDGVCSYGRALEDGSGDWLTVEANAVIRYNPETGTVRTVFTGDFDCYDYSTSPGGLYQGLGFSINERCDEYAVLDLQSGEIVYRTPHTFEDGRVRWVNHDTLLFYEMADGDDYLVHPSTGEEISLPRVLSEPGGGSSPFSQDGRWITVRSDDGAILAYDTITHQLTTITSPLNHEDVSARWQLDGTLRIMIRNDQGVPLGDWRVRLL